MGPREYYNQTNVHPVGLAAVLILGCLLVAVPRRYALLPVVVLACFIPAGQRLVIAGLDFHFLRLMVMFGMVRVMCWGELKGFVWKRIDTVTCAIIASSVIFYSIQQDNFSATITACGEAMDDYFSYFLFRCLVKSWTDVRTAITGFIVVSIPVTLAFMVEMATGRNAFGVFGGVPMITDVREGRLRCQGAFAHSILAGCFWAALLPLFVAKLWEPPGRGRQLAWIGTATSLLLVMLSASSTPISAVIMAAIGAALFPLRYKMRWIRWGVVLTLVCLHMVMKAPVWHLISRLDIIGGSTGWHRYFLIDNAIRHFDEWWFCGLSDTLHWGWGMQDITNQYILVGIRGGIVTLALYIWMIALAFQGVGRMVRQYEGNRTMVVASWALGVALFVHCTSFIAVSYFGQIEFLWAMNVAFVASLSPTTDPVRTANRPSREPRRRAMARARAGSLGARRPVPAPATVSATAPAAPRTPSVKRP